MPHPFSPIQGKIPLVGSQFEAFDATITVVVRCSCDSDNKPFMVSERMPMACAKCRNIYVVEQTEVKVVIRGKLPEAPPA